MATTALGEVLRERSVYKSCGKRHWGYCLIGMGTCFRCKQARHTADQCPSSSFASVGVQPLSSHKGSSSQQQQQGRVYATNRREAEHLGIVLIGTLPILGHYALALFDFGLSHSFISSLFVKHAMLVLEPLGYVLSVSTPSGEIMLACEKIKACQLEIANCTLDVTLIVLDMRDFDVILGMDWLVANHASIRKPVLS
ncbi:uncharacterized protein LOC120081117 [Benincasa hispida]|uniref:uncharacterized protein LOC120081117 n=1 Tax=Benincasa hispida TaxID=102211 RepID=UPI0018FF1BF1|nr:uncharacterized protein LOC120081117 [Benincasa hispida]